MIHRADKHKFLSTLSVIIIVIGFIVAIASALWEGWFLYELYWTVKCALGIL